MKQLTTLMLTRTEIADLRAGRPFSFSVGDQDLVLQAERGIRARAAIGEDGQYDHAGRRQLPRKGIAKLYCKTYSNGHRCDQGPFASERALGMHKRRMHGDLRAKKKRRPYKRRTNI